MSHQVFKRHLKLLFGQSAKAPFCSNLKCKNYNFHVQDFIHNCVLHTHFQLCKLSYITDDFFSAEYLRSESFAVRCSFASRSILSITAMLWNDKRYFKDSPYISDCKIVSSTETYITRMWVFASLFVHSATYGVFMSHRTWN